MICLNATAIPRNSITISPQGVVPNQRSMSQPISAPPTRLPINAAMTRLPCEYPLSASGADPPASSPLPSPRLPQPLVERVEARIVRAVEIPSGLVFRHAHPLAC